MIESLIQKAERSGFLAVGLTRPDKPLFFDKFREWLAEGRNAEMQWLNRHRGVREDPCKLLDGCRTLISLAYPYSPRKPSSPDGFTAARYSEPRYEDYHKRLGRLAKAITQPIADSYPGCKTRICVDSAPLLERSFAYMSGLGFIGKNNMLVIPSYGSYFFLAEILVTARLPLPQTAPMANKCGGCSRCIDACPTGALDGPYSFDASKCLSYLTIEYDGILDEKTAQRMGKCFFGCDICQEVCPFNQGRFDPDISLPPTGDILDMKSGTFEISLGKTSFSRAGLEIVKRNIRAIRSGSAFN